MNIHDLAPRSVKQWLFRIGKRLNKANPLNVPVDADSLRAAFEQRSKHILRTLDGLPNAPLGRNDKLIFDLGMHVGQDTDYYLRKGFRVIAIEANPILAAQAEQRFGEALREGRLKILNIGIGEKRARLEFHVNLQLSEWSSFKPDTASRGMPTAPVSVEMTTIGDVVRSFGTPYYLKIDIEGLDGAAVMGLSECPVKPRFVSFENGQVALFEKLIGFGYTRFKFINQAHVPDMAPPNPAREGNTIDYVFSYGASGPFGDDTPGEWLDAEAMRPVLEAHRVALASGTYDAVKDGWFDLHAKLE